MNSNDVQDLDGDKRANVLMINTKNYSPLLNLNVKHNPVFNLFFN